MNTQIVWLEAELRDRVAERLASAAARRAGPESRALRGIAATARLAGRMAGAIERWANGAAYEPSLGRPASAGSR